MLSTIVTAEMCSGVLEQVTSLLPILIPVTISFIAIRKGISFLISTLRGA